MAPAPLERHPASWPLAGVQIYTGDGKGKTTAAFGLLLRAVGHGLGVFVGQFMKSYPYGELAGAQLLGERVVIEQLGSPECLPWREQPAAVDVDLARAGLRRCRERMRSGEYALVVLDEALVAVHFRLLTEADLLAFLDERPPLVEVVLTGRWATPALVARADLVTELREVKHPYTRGWPARDGIER
ncbi:MAG: cob(I)yrinic acid a,c-diamide adenosyltransferase [Myxococcota bacterium]|jgi:cob(I)alamin adenosyltransferase|nr:cob(I)yrinic acid a,c-diamide adenosyltransferase [Myxococcota bacterium]